MKMKIQHTKPTKYNEGSPRRNFYSNSCLITKSERSLIKKKNFMMYYKILEKQEQTKPILVNERND